MVNGQQGRDYLESVAIASKSIFEIGEAVDTEDFERVPSPEERAAVRKNFGIHGECYLFCGTLKPLKGVDYLLDAWAGFMRAADVDGTLLIVGDGPERARLEHRAQEAGLSNVRFLGHIQRERMPAIYHAADVFVFPTLEDCWALAVNEAMVAGLPIINSKYAGSVDLITEGVTGWTIDPLNPADLLHGLQSAWNARHDRERMSRAARTAVAKMSISAVAERIRRTVESVRLPRREGGPR